DLRPRQAHRIARRRDPRRDPGRPDPRRRRLRQRRRRRRDAHPVRLRALHAHASARAQAALAGSRSPGSGGSLPLSRRDLRDRPDAPEREPVLHAEHHRPAHPADDRRRDDARRRPGARRRPPALYREVRRPVARRPAPRGGRGSRRVRRLCADDLPCAPRRRHPRQRRAARARRRAGSPARRREPAADDVPRAGPRARVDRARLSRDRERPGRARRRRQRRRRPARARSRATEGGRMSGIVLSSRQRSRAFVLSLDADTIAVALVATVALVLTIVTWRTWGDIGQDTGYDFVAATRVAHGHLPYTDFVYYYGPLAPFALGLAALIGGGGFMTFAAVGLVLAYAIVAATYALARTQTGPIGAAIAAAGTAAIAFSPTNVSFVVPHTYSESFAILLTLGFLLGLARASAGSRGAALAGICAGLVALTRPEFEAAVLAAAAVWLVVRARGGRPVRGLLVRIALPAALVPAVVYGAYLTALSPHRLFFENLYPVDTLRAGGSAILRSQAPLT